MVIIQIIRHGPRKRRQNMHMVRYRPVASWQYLIKVYTHALWRETK